MLTLQYILSEQQEVRQGSLVFASDLWLWKLKRSPLPATYLPSLAMHIVAEPQEGSFPFCPATGTAPHPPAWGSGQSLDGSSRE